MHPRPAPPPSRATLLAVVACACLIVSIVTSSALAADKDKEKRPNRQVVKYVAHKEKVNVQGKLVMVLAVESLTGGRQTELVVKNHDMNKRDYNPVINTDNVNALSKGDPIKIELEEGRNGPMVTYLRKYELKPGEEARNVYRFMSRYNANNGAYTAVVLNRFDEPVTVALPKAKSRDGGPGGSGADSTAEMERLVDKLNAEDLVEAEIRESRPVPVLVSLDRYTPPQTGKFVKLSDEEVGDGQKGQAVEIERDGKTVKAIVAGKLQNKKWVSDGKVLAAVRKLKPEAEVVFRTRQDGDKLYLKDIEPAPKPQRERMTSRDRDARDRDMRDRDRDADGADAGERRGRRPRNDK